jgi:inhibitor of cysteine peptidase
MGCEESMKNNNTFIGIIVLITIVLVTIATFSLGCAEPPVIPDNESIPMEDNDSAYVYGDASVESIQIMTLESFPVQIHVIATGYLPDGCTSIDEKTVSFDDEENSFTVHITTIRPADAMCTEALVPFEENIVLDVYGLDKGSYTVNANGITDEFELQVDNIPQE